MSLRRVYESTFILNAALEDSDIEAAMNKVISYIENHGGIILEINKWGRRRLAYPINKKYNGFYIHLIFEATPNTIPILERFFVLEDTVLRHLTLILPKRLMDFREKKSAERGMPYDNTVFEQNERKILARGESALFSFSNNKSDAIAEVAVEPTAEVVAEPAAVEGTESAE